MKPLELITKFRKHTNQYENFKYLSDDATKERHYRAFNQAVEQIKDQLRGKTKEVKGAKVNPELEEILIWENQRRRLKPMENDDWHLLNELEVAHLESECEMVLRISSGRHAHFEPGEFYKYRKTYNPAKGYNTYEVFAVIVRTSEQRSTPQIRQKLKQGLNVTQEEFLPDLELHDRITLGEPEWLKHFRHVDQVNLDNSDLLDDAIVLGELEGSEATA